MAISLQRIVRSTSCLILGWGFLARQIEWTYFRLDQIQDGGWWKISNGHISATGHPIDFAFDPRVGFSGTADRMDLLSVGSNPRWRLSGTGPIDFLFDPRWGFLALRIEWTYFRLDQIQDGSGPPSWKISNGHISGTGRPINFVFDPRVGFSGTAD